MKLKNSVYLLLFISLFLFPFQSRATNKNDYTAAADVLHSIAEVNKEIALSKDDATLHKLLENKNNLLHNLLLIIRGSFISYNNNDLYKDELSLLQSKIAINRSRGNTVAVQRDQYEVNYYLTARKIGLFAEYLVNASRNYETEKQISAKVKKNIKALKSEIKSLSPPPVGEGKIYTDAAQRYNELRQIQAVYMDFLRYVLEHPDLVVTTSIFQKISLISTIAYFNSIESFSGINRLISPLKIDVGGLIVSLSLLLLTLISFPVVSRCSNYLVDRFILNDDNIDHTELIFLSLRKPILYLLFLFGIDLAMNALLYKTDYKTTVDNFAFILYILLDIFLLFNLTDSIASTHADLSDKHKKEYSKELLLLSVKSIKGIVIIIAFTFILSHFGINVSAILSTLGLGGLAFAMAAKDSLSNFFGGLNIMIDRIFKMGDWIKIDTVEGTVVEIGLRSTTVRTFDNALITMPNSLVSTASVLNWNRRSVGRRIKMYIGVTYESNMDDIHNALTDIKQMLANHPDIANPKKSYSSDRRMHNKFLSREALQGIKTTQLVYLDRYSDFSIDILIYCFSTTVHWDQWLEVKQDVLFEIADILDNNHLSFAYPTHVQINRNESQEYPRPGDLLVE